MAKRRRRSVMLDTSTNLYNAYGYKPYGANPNDVRNRADTKKPK